LIGAGFFTDLSFHERLCNAFLGVSVIGWAVMGVVHASLEDRFTLVRITISLLNLIVGLFVMLRMPLAKSGSLKLILAALPSLLVAGIAYKLSPAPHLWPLPAQILFAAGGIIAVTAFLFLGRNFAILPALREVVVKGPYGLVRHPAYLGELLMVLACAAAMPTMRTVAPCVIGIPLVMARIVAEEHLLCATLTYRMYADRVRYRLIPHVW
jgi:protein-S-isoprenylcysteine O-methyltransferase Ste14